MPYELAALLCALTWALGSIITADLARDLGGVTFNRIRNTGVFLMLSVFISAIGAWSTVQQGSIFLILLSGLIGIALGDSALFTAMKRIGPRRTQMLYACNAPITVALSMWFLEATLSTGMVIGALLVFLGAVIAIGWGKRETNQHRWEQVQGSLLVGVGFGLLGAFGQAVGAILIKPVLDEGAHPVAITALRMGISALVLNVHWLWKKHATNAEVIVATGKQIALTSFNGFLSIGVGVSLLMYAFSKGDVGIASTLSATTPVMVLPILWIVTGERPSWGAWAGAILAVIGISLLVAV